MLFYLPDTQQSTFAHLYDLPFDQKYIKPVPVYVVQVEDMILCYFPFYKEH